MGAVEQERGPSLSERKWRLGFALRNAIFESGLTPTEIAERIGVESRTVDRWAQEETYPRLRDRRLLAEILGLPELIDPPEVPEYWQQVRAEASLEAGLRRGRRRTRRQ